ncbi:MAG TPA: MBG domain-containing protein [Terriglobales bacterium]|nr:MBG domain-containing protein [Terriglobales bacterium]
MKSISRLFVVLTCIFLVAATSTAAFAQEPLIYTVAGSGPGAGIEQTGKSTADSQGNLYVTDTAGARVVKVTNPTSPSPSFSVVAGTGVRGYLGDNGPASGAQLKSPCSVALDLTETNLYIADGCGYTDGRIRRVNLQSGVIELVASGFNPRSVAVDANNNILVPASGNILKITGGVVSTFYTRASFSNINPYVVAVDRADAGNTVYFSGSNVGKGIIVKIPNANGVPGAPVIMAGTSVACATPCWDGSSVPPLSMSMDFSPVLVVSNGYVYFNSQMDNRIGRFASDGSGVVQLLAGDGTNIVSGDGGLATSAGLGNYNVYGMAVAGSTVFFGGASPQVLRYFDVGAEVYSVTLPGNPNYQGDGGPATSATVGNNIKKVAFDANGNMYIADQKNRAVRRVDKATETMSTAVTGAQLDAGLPANTHVGNFDIANDSLGNIFVATDINGLFKLSATGVFSKVVPDTPFSSSTLRDVAVDGKGNVYVLAGNTAVDRVTSTGANRETVYENASVTLLSIGVDKDKNLWVTQAAGPMRDQFSIAQVWPTAGGSQALVNIGAKAVATYPVTGDPRGGVVYMDNFVAKALDGEEPTNIAGQSGTDGFAGDNEPAANSTLSSALGLAFDTNCHLYISDSENQRIRKVENYLDVTVSASQPGAQVTVDGIGGGGSFRWLAGTQHTLATTSPQAAGAGSRLIFQNWSLASGGTSTQLALTFTPPGCNRTPAYTANFVLEHQLTVEIPLAVGGTVTPVSGGYYPKGDVVSLQATANPGYAFVSWTGPVADANWASTTVLMNGPVTIVANFVRLVPDLTVTKSHEGSFTQGDTEATYTISVSNNGTAATDGTAVSVVDTLPASLTPVSLSGAGWTCNFTNVSCARSDVLPVNGSYPPITLRVGVSLSAPPSITNTVRVSGGGEEKLDNNAASDVTAVKAAANLSLTANPGSTLTYGTALTVSAGVAQAAGFPVASGSVSYSLDGGPEQVAGLSASSATLNLGVLSAGDHTLTVEYSGDGSYSTTQKTLAVKINPAPLTVTVNNASRAYGSSNPVFVSHVAGFVNGDTEAALTGAPSCVSTAVESSAVSGGPYPITCSGLSATNYALTYVPGELTITPVPLTVTANNKLRIYGTANPAFDGTLSGVQSFDSISATYSSSATPSSPVGDYAITVTLADPGSRLSNYTVTNTPGTLTVTKAGITVVANNASRSYGGANPTFDGTLTGIAAGDNITASYSSSATSLSPVGTYPIKPELADPNGRLANYDVTSTDGVLTVNRASLTVTVNNKQRIYGAANPVLDGTMAGVVAGDDITVTYSTTANVPSPVGTYSITATLIDPNVRLGNYNVSNTEGTLSVQQAALSIVVNDKQRAYGAVNPVLDGTIAGMVAGDGITATYSTAATAASPVGTYGITHSLADPNGKLSNYAVTATSGTLTVTKAALFVSASNKQRAYGTANPVFDGSLTGVVAGDNITATYSTAATESSPVATYAITPALVDPGNKLANYEVNSTDGTLTITQAALSVTANDKQRTYGTANPAFDGSLTGVVVGDGITASYTSPATESSPAGAYTITPSLSDPNNKLSNYAVTSVDGTLIVSKAALTVTANDKQKVYGAPNPAFDGTLTGAVPGDNLSVNYVTTASASSPVASGYAITPEIVDPQNRLSNYDVTSVPGMLRITAASLNVAASDASRVYGIPNPTFTGTLTGVVAGDGITATYATTATTGSTVGTYAIKPVLVDPGSRLANYNVSVSDGTLTVTKANLRASANSKERVYGAANPVLDGVLQGVAAGDDITATFSTEATPASSVGDHAITVTLADPGARLANYAVTLVTGTLSITPSPLTVTTNDKTRTYNTANPVLDGSLTGLLNDDPITVSYTTAATQASDAGTYTITAVLSDPASRLGNYSVTNPGGTLTITPAGTSVALASSAPMSNSGASLTLTATVQSNAGTPSGTVTFLNGDSALGTSTVNGSGVAALTTSSLPVGTHSIVARYEGSQNFSGSVSASLSQVIAVPAVKFSTVQSPPAIKAGQSVTIQLPTSSAGVLTAPVTFACSGLPTGAACSFSPQSVSPANLPATVNLTITTTRLTILGAARPQAPGWTFAIVLPGLFLLPAGMMKRRWTALLLLALTFVALLTMVGCGSGTQHSGLTNASQSTSPGTYTVTITATSAGAAQATTTVQITVTP